MRAWATDESNRERYRTYSRVSGRLGNMINLRDGQHEPGNLGCAKPKIQLYNTLSKSKEIFEPLNSPKVAMYLCGPTVYAESHIGHMVGPVIFDTIKRYLTYCEYDVTWAVNITDIDDKLIAKSHERGVPISQIAVEMTGDYLANLRDLGVDQIDFLPRATDHIDEIIDFIRLLCLNGFAYESAGDVFFEVAKDSNYGELSNRSVSEMRGDGGGAGGKKRAAGDFALWKAAKHGEPSWQSPWGRGRPGWHIECSAMSKKLFGETFDIHGGGLDLMFPHHENELAQSFCCHNKPMVKYWLHNGLMRSGSSGKVGGRSTKNSDLNYSPEEKISRSKGAGGLSTLINRYGGECIRFFLLRTHYRSTILYEDDSLNESDTSLMSFYRFFSRFSDITGKSFYDMSAPRRRANLIESEVQDNTIKDAINLRESFLSAMDDDFNTGLAVGFLFDLVRLINRHIDLHNLSRGFDASKPAWMVLMKSTEILRELSLLLGLFKKPRSESAHSVASSELTNSLMQMVIDLRKQARQSRDYATSDKIRNRLGELNIQLLDKNDHTSWEFGT